MRKCSVCKRVKKHYPRRGGLKCWACISAAREATPWGRLLHCMRNARTRCTNPNKENYKYYGGRGIEFRLTHEEAREELLQDFADLMKQGLTPTIDRIDPDGHYESGNVQALDFSENAIKAHKDRI